MNKEYLTEYNLNQYENDKENYINGRFKKVAVYAKYIKQDEPTYQNNELIEALPPLKSMENVFDLLEKIPIYSDLERQKNPLYRLHAVYRLEEYLFPISKHFEIEQNIAIAIRRGYINKKIFSIEHINKLRKLSMIMNSSAIDFKQYINSHLLSINDSPSANGFSIIGVSGGGKSTAVDNILSFYPQHIIHLTDGDKKFLFHQITYLKIECTYNGNIKGLCQKFFSSVDDVLGTDYSLKYGNARSNIDRMIIAIAHIALKHGLGLLVIDEIQHLKSLKNKGSDAALNFFVTLMNEIKLPTIFIGTYKAIETLSYDFRQSRRTNGIGIVEMNYLEREEFDILLEDLWEYQWIKNKCILTDELRECMFNNTMGILDVIIKLFITVQVEAIRSEKDTINVSLINRIAKDKFPFVKKIIDAIRDKNYEALKNYEDIKNPWYDELLDNTKTIFEDKEKARQIQNGEKRKSKLKEKELVDNLCIFLEEMGYEYINVEEVVLEVIKKHGKNKDISFLKKEVAKKLLQISSITNDNQDNNKKHKIKNGQNKNKDLNRYDSYDEFIEENKKGFIVGITEEV